MIKGKKIISVLMILTMVLVMALGLLACKSSSNSESSSVTSSSSSSSTSESTSASSSSSSTLNDKPDTSKFVNVNYVMLGDKPTNGQLEKVQEKWNALLKDKANASLDITWVEWTDWFTKYNLLLASGEPLDLVTTASDWLDLWPNAQKGAFMPLDDLLPKYAPQTWASVPKEDWEECKLNGKIMTIPENQYTQWVNHGFIYRGDWAREFGITQPITTWEEFGKYLQGIKENKKGVIPWDFPAAGYSSSFGWFQSKTQEIAIDPVPMPMNGGYLFYGKSAEDPCTVVCPYFEDSFVDYAKFMKQWGDAGYWREDALNWNGDGWVEMKAGKNGTRQHHTQTYVGVYHEMELAQPGADLQFFSFSAESNNLLEMSITHGATSLGAHSKNPERALMVYDLIRNDAEMYKLFNYGIEGVQYVIKDGKRDLPEGYNQDRDGFYTDFWGGRNDKLEIPSATIYPKYQEVYAQYDKIKKPYPYGRLVFDKTPVENEIAAVADVVNRLLPAISCGKAGDPVKAVNDFRDQLKKAGFDTYMAEVQKQLAAYKSVIGK